MGEKLYLSSAGDSYLAGEDVRIGEDGLSGDEDLPPGPADVALAGKVLAGL